MAAGEESPGAMNEAHVPVLVPPCPTAAAGNALYITGSNVGSGPHPQRAEQHGGGARADGRRAGTHLRAAGAGAGTGTAVGGSGGGGAEVFPEGLQPEALRPEARERGDDPGRDADGGLSGTRLGAEVARDVPRPVRRAGGEGAAVVAGELPADAGVEDIDALHEARGTRGRGEAVRRPALPRGALHVRGGVLPGLGRARAAVHQVSGDGGNVRTGTGLRGGGRCATWGRRA